MDGAAARGLLVGLGVAGALLLGGCSGSASQSTPSSTQLDDAFALRLDQTCTRSVAVTQRWVERHPFPVPGFDRYAPEPDEMPRVAAYYAGDPSVETLADGIERLGEPSSGAGAWTRFRTDLQRAALLHEQQVGLLRQGDPTAFVLNVMQSEQLTQQLESRLVGMGLDATSPCRDAV